MWIVAFLLTLIGLCVLVMAWLVAEVNSLQWHLIDHAEQLAIADETIAAYRDYYGQLPEEPLL